MFVQHGHVGSRMQEMQKKAFERLDAQDRRNREQQEEQMAAMAEQMMLEQLQSQRSQAKKKNKEHLRMMKAMAEHRMTTQAALCQSSSDEEGELAAELKQITQKADAQMNSLLSRANRSFQAASKHQSQDQRSLQSYVMEILTENKSFTAVDQALWTEAEAHYRELCLRMGEGEGGLVPSKQ